MICIQDIPGSRERKRIPSQRQQQDIQAFSSYVFCGISCERSCGQHPVPTTNLCNNDVMLTACKSLIQNRSFMAMTSMKTKVNRYNYCYQVTQRCHQCSQRRHVCLRLQQWNQAVSGIPQSTPGMQSCMNFEPCVRTNMPIRKWGGDGGADDAYQPHPHCWHRDSRNGARQILKHATSHACYDQHVQCCTSLWKEWETAENQGFPRLITP